MESDAKNYSRAAVIGEGKVWLADGDKLPLYDGRWPALFDLGDAVCACRREDLPGDAALTSVELRASYRLLAEEEYEKAAKASELLFWERTVRYCPRCGTALERATNISKKCPQCGAEHFPSPATAIIVLVTDGNGRALLVHARSFKRPFFGLVAGFVETGESAEECVRREVMEETSLRVRDVRYVASQSWPFPFQLMLGFTATAENPEELRFADGELTDGGFYTPDALPPLATPPSLARILIDRWLAAKL